jgi:hypothetical protein
MLFDARIFLANFGEAHEQGIPVPMAGAIKTHGVKSYYRAIL